MRADSDGTAVSAGRTRLEPAAVALAAVHRPPAADIGLLLVAVLAVSTSGPLIAAAAAPSLAIAFYRNAMASGVLLPWALTRCGAELRALDRREWCLALLAGVLLAAHFATWTPSLALTSVASATALVATQPVWAALIAHLRGSPIARRAWFGIAVSVLAAALLTGIDFSASARALAGDGLALVGGIFAAMYVTTGAEVRRSVSTTAYTLICYGTASVLLLVACLATRAQLGGYPPVTWLQLLALTAGAQLLGHSVINRVLRTTSPTVVSLAILLEVPGAALIAAGFLHQRPPAAAIPAAALLLAGIGLVVGVGAGSGAPPAALDVD